MTRHHVPDESLHGSGPAMSSTTPERDAAPPQPDGREAGQEPEAATALPPEQVAARWRQAHPDVLRRVRAALDRL